MINNWIKMTKLKKHNMFFGATVVAREIRITHTLHYCQLSVIQLLTNIKEFERETETEREKKIQINRQNRRKERERGRERERERERILRFLS